MGKGATIRRGGARMISKRTRTRTAGNRAPSSRVWALPYRERRGEFQEKARRFFKLAARAGHSPALVADTAAAAAHHPASHVFTGAAQMAPYTRLHGRWRHPGGVWACSSCGTRSAHMKTACNDLSPRHKKGRALERGGHRSPLSSARLARKDPDTKGETTISRRTPGGNRCPYDKARPVRKGPVRIKEPRG